MEKIITRDDVLNFMSDHENGPLPSPAFRKDESAWIEWQVFAAPEHFVKQNPQAVLDIAFNPPDFSPKRYSLNDNNAIEVEGGALLGFCAKILPDLFIHKMTELLPFAQKEVTRCTLFWGLMESHLPQSFELLKSLMPATTEYNNKVLVSFIETVEYLGRYLKREEETWVLLRQIEESTPPHRTEVHKALKELEAYFEAIEKEN